VTASEDRAPVTMKCGECGHTLDEAPATPAQDRTACPECGSLRRLGNVTFNDVGIDFHERLDVKGKRGERGKPFVEIRTGEDQRRTDGLWMKKERIIDREGDRDTETVIDPETGEVIHHTDKPLTKHRWLGAR
jgi:DNA-directed RNA polymerase subunit RPC12/RpoP